MFYTILVETKRRRKKAREGDGDKQIWSENPAMCFCGQAVGELSGCQGRHSHCLLGVDFGGETRLLLVLGGIKYFQLLPV